MRSAGSLRGSRVSKRTMSTFEDGGCLAVGGLDGKRGDMEINARRGEGEGGPHVRKRHHEDDEVSSNTAVNGGQGSDSTWRAWGVAWRAWQSRQGTVCFRRTAAYLHLARRGVLLRCDGDEDMERYWMDYNAAVLARRRLR